MSRPLATAILIVCHLLLAGPSAAQAQPQTSPQPATVMLVRHAEKESSGTDAGMQSSSDPALTDAGRARARLLAGILKDAGITAVFTSTARRTKETAAPLADASHLTPAIISEDLAQVRAQVLAAASPRPTGASTPATRTPPTPGRVLIVGHSNTVPALIAALGGPSDVKIADPEFDGLFILTVPPKGPAALLTLRYGASAGAVP